MLAVRRADLIAIPTAVPGSHRRSDIYPGEGAPEPTPEPEGADPGAAPGPAGDPDAARSLGQPEVLVVRHRVRTKGVEGAWMDQSRMLAGRRVDLAVPLVLDTAGAAFERWRSRPGLDASAWTAYEQGRAGTSGQG